MAGFFFSSSEMAYVPNHIIKGIYMNSGWIVWTIAQLS